jgi:hypothetical protein
MKGVRRTNSKTPWFRTQDCEIRLRFNLQTFGTDLVHFYVSMQKIQNLQRFQWLSNVFSTCEILSLGSGRF